jgi:hypothetical protein
MKQLFLTLLAIVAIAIFATKCHYNEANVSTNYWWADTTYTDSSTTIIQYDNMPPHYTGEIDSGALKILQENMFIINKK